MKKNRLFILLAVVFASLSTTYGQGSWSWPEDADKRKTAEENNALYTDMFKADNFAAAKKPLDWLLRETPDLNPSIYINGVKIYGALADAEKNTARKNVLQDSTILLYDLRMKHFNDVANVTNRKAYDAFMQWRERRDKYEELYNILNNALELNGEDVLDGNLVAFMSVIRLYKLTFKKLSDEDVLKHYEDITKILNAKESASNNNPRYVRYREQIEKLLEVTVDINCDFIQNNYGIKLNENPTDFEIANKIVKYAFPAKCTDEEFFIKAAKVVTKAEPDYGLLKYLAVKLKDKERYDEAEKYFTKSIEFTDENLKKADVYLELADIAKKRGQKATARDYLLKSLNTDPSKKETVYDQIGYLYYTSYEECKKAQSRVDDYAIFIAAYDMFAKAGNAKMMETCKSLFPSREDIFTEGKAVGSSIPVNCWIKESVSLRTRD